VKTKKFFMLVLTSAIATGSVCQGSFGKVNILSKAAPRSQIAFANSSPTPSPIKGIDKEYEAYREEVLQRFLKKDFSWIDREGGKVRSSKERLGGGYWKLRALYAAIEKPAGDKPSDGDWDDLIRELVRWSEKQPQSVTAKVALATAWKGYAWIARGGSSSDTVSSAAWEAFEKRLATAAQVLSEAAALKERCPYWYVTAIWIGIGQSWDRGALEKLFEAGVKLEPTFYYVYQAKASYLLPRWGGTEGDWERFAEASALNLGGNQGDIIFFMIYSQMLTMQGMSLMNTHQNAVPKLIAGFRSIEKLYGAAPHRLNEACLFASFGNDLSTQAELFSRIGDSYDEAVWHSKKTFEIFREGFLNRAKSSQLPKQKPGPSVSQTAPLK
jgi:hypothetical protein